MNRAMQTLAGAFLVIVAAPGAGQAQRVSSQSYPISMQAPPPLSTSQRLDSARARLGRSDLATTALGKVLKVSPAAPLGGKGFALWGHLIDLYPTWINLSAARGSSVSIVIATELLPSPALLDCVLTLKQYTPLTITSGAGKLQSTLGPGDQHVILAVGTKKAYSHETVTISPDDPDPKQAVVFHYCDLTPIKM